MDKGKPAERSRDPVPAARTEDDVAFLENLHEKKLEKKVKALKNKEIERLAEEHPKLHHTARHAPKRVKHKKTRVSRRKVHHSATYHKRRRNRKTVSSRNYRHIRHRRRQHEEPNFLEMNNRSFNQLRTNLEQQMETMREEFKAREKKLKHHLNRIKRKYSQVKAKVQKPISEKTKIVLGNGRKAVKVRKLIRAMQLIHKLKLVCGGDFKNCRRARIRGKPNGTFRQMEREAHQLGKEDFIDEVNDLKLTIKDILKSEFKIDTERLTLPQLRSLVEELKNPSLSDIQIPEGIFSDSESRSKGVLPSTPMFMEQDIDLIPIPHKTSRAEKLIDDIDAEVDSDEISALSSEADNIRREHMRVPNLPEELTTGGSGVDSVEIEDLNLENELL